MPEQALRPATPIPLYQIVKLRICTNLKQRGVSLLPKKGDRHHQTHHRSDRARFLLWPDQGESHSKHHQQVYSFCKALSLSLICETCRRCREPAMSKLVPSPHPKTLPAAKKQTFDLQASQTAAFKMLIRANKVTQRRKARANPPLFSRMPNKPKNSSTLNQEVHRTMPRTASRDQIEETIQPLGKVPCEAARTYTKQLKKTRIANQQVHQEE